MKDTIHRLKIICLMDMHHSPWTDTSRFQKGEMTLMKAKLNTLSSDEITAEFNTIVSEKLFHNGSSLQNYPVCP